MAFDLLNDIYRGVERDALHAMLKEIAPKICAEDCPPYLVVGHKFTTEASFTGAWVTIHLSPILCSDKQTAQAVLQGYEGGCVVETEDLRNKFFTCFNMLSTCKHCHRADSGEIVCDKGNKEGKRGCADFEME